MRCELMMVWLGVALTWSQRLPTRDEQLFRLQAKNAETSHWNTKVLPDGMEVRNFLFEDVTKTYYFFVEDEGSPVLIVVEPCDTEIEWKVTQHEVTEGVGPDGSGQTEQMEEQGRKGPSLTGPVVGTFSGHDVMSYYNRASQRAMYRVQVTSRGADTLFGMYATTTPDSDKPYPEVPENPEVRASEVGKSSATLSWEPSPTETKFHLPVKYCIAVNRARNLKTLCAVTSRRSGGDDMPMPPPPFRFGFDFDFKSFGFKRRGKKRRNRDKIVFPDSKAIAPQENILFECVGDKTAYTVAGLQPGTQYFYDVFVVSTLTNRSSAYTGGRLETKQHKRRTRLKDGKVTTATVKRSKGQAYTVTVGDTQSSPLQLTVQSCMGEVSVKVSREGDVVAKESRVNSLWNLVLTNLTEGDYQVAVNSKRKRPSTFKIFSTTNPAKYPYAQMPSDTKIKQFEKLTTCDSATIAWLVNDERSKYCVYKSVVSKKVFRRRSERDNSCESPRTRKKDDKVICRHHRPGAVDRSVMIERISGLKPGTRYKFDVYVQKHRGETGQALKYRSVYIKTKRRC
ncbi:protein NDNF-like [Branchiostoma floridae x Branchiostoma belcheri]